jgi:hypothetical protein
VLLTLDNEIKRKESFAMEAFFDKSDSVLKTVVYGSAFCRYIISRCSSGEETIERIENVTDIFYRIRSVFGVMGIYLDWPSLSHEWKKFTPKTSDLSSKLKEVCHLGVLSSGIASNAMDFFAAILWLIPRLRDLYYRLRACLDVVTWLRPRRRVITSVRSLPTMDVTSAVASSESSSSLDDVRERVEWLSNVFWASMSTLSLVSSLYAMYRAFQRARAQSLQPPAAPLVSQSEEEEDEEPSVREAGIEALECALDLIGGASGAMKLECEAEGLTGIGPTLASCIHFVQIANSAPESLVSSLALESSDPQACGAVDAADRPASPKLTLVEELVSPVESAAKVDLVPEKELDEDEIDNSPRRERKFSELENKKEPRITPTRDNSNIWSNK